MSTLSIKLSRSLKQEKWKESTDSKVILSAGLLERCCGRQLLEEVMLKAVLYGKIVRTSSGSRALSPPASSPSPSPSPSL